MRLLRKWVPAYHKPALQSYRWFGIFRHLSLWYEFQCSIASYHSIMFDPLEMVLSTNRCHSVLFDIAWHCSAPSTFDSFCMRVVWCSSVLFESSSCLNPIGIIWRFRILMLQKDAVLVLSVSSASLALHVDKYFLHLLLHCLLNS